jgi:hypothetical protein
MLWRFSAVGAALVATPVAAEPGFYFHKPGVVRSAFEADLGGCVALAGGVSVELQSVSSSNPYAAAVGRFLSGLLAARERRALVTNIMRTCMADKGYRRVAASKAVLKQMGALAESPRMTRLYDLAAQAEPLGEVLPR